jgi:DNA-binding XRE family transcriptional regulator
MGNSLSNFRKKAGLTQQQVGDYIGISAQAVSKWENDQSEPDIDTLYKLAELYKTTVDELTGKETSNNVKSSSKSSRFKELAKKHKMKIIIAGVALVLAVIAIIVCVSIYSANEYERMFANYEKIELGMTMDEVEDILGKAEDTHVEENKGYVAEGMAEAIYGFANAEFWYYRGAGYDENQKALENLDLNAEYQPYYQIRISFNENGKVVETYFISECSEIAVLTDYGTNEDKELLSFEFLNDTTDIKGEEDVKLTFEDGSVYLGTVELLKNNKINHPWGDFILK